MQGSLLRPQLLAPKLLAAILASLGMLTVLPAAATVIDGLSAEATAQVTGNSAQSDGPHADTPFTSASAYQGSGDSYATASSFGQVAGPYGAGANGNGTFDATGHFVRSWALTNDSGVAQHYVFNFLIYGGGMSAYDGGAGGTGFAEFVANITRDGTTSLFSSTAKFDSNGNVVTTGTELDGWTPDGSGYRWDRTLLHVDLGVLDDGQSTTIAYELVGHAFGAYGFDTTCGNDYGYGGDGYGDGYGYGGDGGAVCTGSSQVFLGDPEELNSTPLPGVSIGITVATVPEPATLALLAIAALGAASLRRRRKF